jgi:hypothetical protein
MLSVFAYYLSEVDQTLCSLISTTAHAYERELRNLLSTAFEIGLFRIARIRHKAQVIYLIFKYLLFLCLHNLIR